MQKDLAELNSLRRKSLDAKNKFAQLLKDLEAAVELYDDAVRVAEAKSYSENDHKEAVRESLRKINGIERKHRDTIKVFARWGGDRWLYDPHHFFGKKAHAYWTELVWYHRQVFGDEPLKILGSHARRHKKKPRSVAGWDLALELYGLEKKLIPSYWKIYKGLVNRCYGGKQLARKFGVAAKREGASATDARLLLAQFTGRIVSERIRPAPIAAAKIEARNFKRLRGVNVKARLLSRKFGTRPA